MPAAKDFSTSALNTFRIELAAIQKTCTNLDAESFNRACEILLGVKGRVVVTGMGKSGHIARKIASTFSSTGTPALFLHAAEAAHGDVGMLQKADALLMLSKSGESEELFQILPSVGGIGIPLIAITCNTDSKLARAARDSGGVVLEVAVDEEACPHDLAPTASTTASLAMGDALAIALLEARNFSSDDFAKLHPAGALGRKLTFAVRDLMVTGKALPIVQESAELSEILLEISAKRLGAACVVNDSGLLRGIITDGDLRRYFQRRAENGAAEKASQIMTANPKTTSANGLAIEALQLMEQEPKVMQLIVIDEKNTVQGMIHLHDIVRAGIS